jgi:hypothetical protein
MVPPPAIAYSAIHDRMLWCNTCHGFFIPSLRAEHEQFHKSYTNRTDGTMSSVTWCDPGNHAFKTGEPGSAHWEANTVGEDGAHTNGSMDACGKHNPFRVEPKNIVKELNAEYPIENA